VRIAQRFNAGLRKEGRKESESRRDDRKPGFDLRLLSSLRDSGYPTTRRKSGGPWPGALHANLDRHAAFARTRSSGINLSFARTKAVSRMRLATAVHDASGRSGSFNQSSTRVGINPAGGASSLTITVPGQDARRDRLVTCPSRLDNVPVSKPKPSAAARMTFALEGATKWLACFHGPQK